MHGAGNDFILMDDRRAGLPLGDVGWIARLCARHVGIGSEGLILIQTSSQAHFQMRFFNPDGSEGAMCGNGARCVARLAYDLQIAPACMNIETRAGMVQAKISGSLVRLNLPAPTNWRLNLPLEIDGQKLIAHCVSVGVPHAVVISDVLDALPLERLGSAIRHHAAFAPQGSNVNFMTLSPPRSLRLRTYERGVEAETLACGTGSAACALVAGRLGLLAPPIQVVTAHGDILEVGFRIAAKTIEDLTLSGPTAYVFEGQINLAL